MNVIAPPADVIATAVRTAWNEALGTRAANPDRSILEMGVGVGRVVRLLAGIEAATGVALPVTAVFHAPTCDALTEMVRGGTAPPPDPIVLIKPGDSSPPLFMLPGLGATVFELFDVGGRIDCPGAVYACQPHGPDGAPPARNIIDQAAYLLGGVKAAVPGGPYRLLGYSFGGLVAMEMARQLHDSGTPAQFVGLLDTTMPEKFWTMPARLGFVRKRLRAHWRQVRGLGVAGGVRHAAGHVRPMLGRLRRMTLGAGANSVAASPFRVTGLPPSLEQSRDANIEALNNYGMRYYDVRVTMFNSADGDPLSCDPLLVWPRYVRGMDVRPVPGAHETMMRGRHAQVLAASISQALREIGGAAAPV